MNCALFLDPRFRGEVLQRSETIDQIKIYLKKLWNRLEIIKGNVPENPSFTSDCSLSSDSSISFEFDAQNELNKYLVRDNNNTDGDDIRLTKSNVDIEQILVNFSPCFLPSTESVLL